MFCVSAIIVGAILAFQGSLIVSWILADVVSLGAIQGACSGYKSQLGRFFEEKFQACETLLIQIELNIFAQVPFELADGRSRFTEAASAISRHVFNTVFLGSKEIGDNFGGDHISPAYPKGQDARFVRQFVPLVSHVVHEKRFKTWNRHIVRVALATLRISRTLPLSESSLMAILSAGSPMTKAASAFCNISDGFGSASTNSGEILQYSVASIFTRATVVRELVSSAIRFTRSIGRFEIDQ